MCLFQTCLLAVALLKWKSLKCNRDVVSFQLNTRPNVMFARCTLLLASGEMEWPYFYCMCSWNSVCVYEKLMYNVCSNPPPDIDAWSASTLIFVRWENAVKKWQIIGDNVSLFMLDNNLQAVLLVCWSLKVYVTFIG